MTKEDDLRQQLAQARETIATLQHELTETNHEVMALTLDLEDRVQERTAELRASNRQLKAEIAERMQAEKSLRESENRYATIAENLPNGMVHVFDRELRYIFNAGKQLQNLGVSNRDLVGKEIHDVLASESSDAVASELARAFEGASVSFETEYADHTFLVNAVPLNRSGEDVDEVLALSIDITRRKRAEEQLERYSELLEEMVDERTRELRETQERMLRQQKLATLGRLAGSVSHELRNPLGAIKNAAYFLTLAVEDLDPDVQEALEILEREVDRSEGVIKGLLDFARSEPPSRQDVSLDQVLEQSLKRMEIPAEVEVVRRLDDGMPKICGDPDQLEEVFLNVAQNGIQAMPDGGRLVIESMTASDEVAVSVSDTGVGIPEDRQEQIFEPLFTTKAKGIGLGLAIVKTLVEGHGGSVEVKSPSTRAFDAEPIGKESDRDGRGTTFTVRLPHEGGARAHER
jgi:PAS domain S-box-containing protein